MTDITTQFNEFSEKVKNLKGTPSDNELLDLYSFFKQATVGDNNTNQPGLLDMKGKAKWNAWNSRKGMPSDEAKQKYVELAKAAIAKYGLK